DLCGPAGSITRVALGAIVASNTTAANRTAEMVLNICVSRYRFLIEGETKTPACLALLYVGKGRLPIGAENLCEGLMHLDRKKASPAEAGLHRGLGSGP